RSGRGGGSVAGGGRGGRGGRSGASSAPATAANSSSDEPQTTSTNETTTSTPASSRPVEVKIDWDGIHDRMHRVSIPNSTESGLVWSADSKKLAFSATVDGRRGTYYVEVGESTTPKLLAAQTGSNARWISQGDQIVWLSQGVPASLTSSGRSSEYRFSAYQEVNTAAKHRAAFELAWRTMRDSFYDERLGNRNWDSIRRKYSDMAAYTTDDI